jgi:Putative beta-barrel porin-2, OmpL-like. bbp2
MKATSFLSIIAAIISITFLSTGTLAQQPSEIRPKSASTAVVSNVVAPPAASASSESIERERLLIDRIERLERRLAELESRAESKGVREPLRPASTSGLPGQSVEGVAKTQPDKTASEPQQISKEDRGSLDFLRDTTFNVSVDGYYGYNFNKPVGRINLLRAYDVMSNSFSLNQASVVIERAPKC